MTNIFDMAAPFKIPLQSEVETYMKTKKNWPDEFVRHYAEKFWNHYQASGWKLSSGNRIKDWKACFNSQWQFPKFKEDIELLNRTTGKPLNAPYSHSSPMKIDIPEIAELDAILTKYRLHPTEVPFTGLAKFYPYMKAERLLKDFTKGDVQEIVKMFNSDQVKCRAYCVEQTFKTYTDKGWTFALTMETRMRLQKPASNVR